MSSLQFISSEQLCNGMEELTANSTPVYVVGIAPFCCRFNFLSTLSSDFYLKPEEFWDLIQRGCRRLWSSKRCVGKRPFQPMSTDSLLPTISGTQYSCFVCCFSYLRRLASVAIHHRTLETLSERSLRIRLVMHLSWDCSTEPSLV